MANIKANPTVLLQVILAYISLITFFYPFLMVRCLCLRIHFGSDLHTITTTTKQKPIIKQTKPQPFSTRHVWPRPLFRDAQTISLYIVLSSYLSPGGQTLAKSLNLWTMRIWDEKNHPANVLSFFLWYKTNVYAVPAILSPAVAPLSHFAIIANSAGHLQNHPFETNLWRNLQNFCPNFSFLFFLSII